MKILNFGSCNIDYVYSVNHIVRMGETISSHSLETFPGGKGLNQSIAIARAGATVYHAGCVGYDGDMLTDLLLESGVDISNILRVGCKNGHAIIQVSEKGDNSIFLYAGSNKMVTTDFVDAVLAHFEEGDLLLLQNEISNVPYIIEKAYQKKMKIIFNPSPFQDEIKQLDFGMLSYVILNEVEAGEISGCDDPESALVYFREAYPDLKVILTLGEKGSIYIDCEQRIRQEAYVIDVVDTTAAGDTFTGYFVASLSSGKSYADALKFASAAAALAVSKNGAAPSSPYQEEVEKSLDYLVPNEINHKREYLKTQIETYLVEHIRDASLPELAKLLNYSTVYTGNLVKQITGETFSDYLQNYRCKLAAKLLLESSLSVKEVIHTVGYENESFFRKMFKEKYHRTPLNYRKREGQRT